jgi:hypothetical protein
MVLLRIHLNSEVPIWILLCGLAGVLVYIWRLRRCPQCGGRLVYRMEPLTQSGLRYRCLYDCPTCHLTWDNGESGDDGSAS